MASSGDFPFWAARSAQREHPRLPRRGRGYWHVSDPAPGGKPAGLEVKGTSELKDDSLTVCLAAEYTASRSPELQQGEDQQLPLLGKLRKKSLAVKPVFVPVSLGATKRPYRNFAQGLYG